jgi:hypothetical protein
MADETVPNLVTIPVDNATLEACRIFEAVIKCEGSNALQYQWSILKGKLKENLKLVPDSTKDFGAPPPPPWPD